MIVGDFEVWYLLAASIMFFATEALTAWFFTQVLSIRNKPMYWALMLALMFATPIVRAGSPSEMTVVANFALLGVPVFMARDSVTRRVVIVAFTTVFNVLCDIVVMIIWQVLIGTDQTNIAFVGANPVEFGLATVLRFAATLPLFIVAARLIDRYFPSKVPKMQVEQPEHSLVLFAWFPFLQMFLLTTAFFVISYQCNHDFALLLCVAAVGLICVCVDLVLVRSFLRASRAHEEKLLVEQLETQLAEYLSSCEKTMLQVESTARIRHDLRNQVQIISELASRGEFDRAQHYVHAMIEEVHNAAADFDDGAGEAADAAGEVTGSGDGEVAPGGNMAAPATTMRGL